MIKRILVGLGDLKYSAVATRYAVELAANHDAEITGVTVFDARRLTFTGPVPIGAGSAARELAEARQQQADEIMAQAISEFEATCNTAGIKHQIRFEEGDPFDELISEARYHDLFVCGLKHLFEHGVVDEPPDELIRMVEDGVRPIFTVTDVHRPVHRVLIAYSGSMESSKTMRQFIQLRPWPEAAVQIVSFGDNRDEARARLHDARTYCRAHGLEPEIECVDGSPKGRLLEYADQWGADLIVLGNSARSLLLRKIFGDVAWHTICQTDRPLFLSQ